MRLIAVLLFLLVAAPAQAQSYLGQYVAYIGNADLYNSNGVRLWEPWQVLRQDRANFHRFGVSQPGDEWDGWFGSINNRAAMERIIMNGYMSPAASNAITNGGATVVVSVYGGGGRITHVDVDVWR